MDANEIGLFLCELRKEKGLKQREVAEAIHVSDKAISRWETGKGIPDISSLQNLSEFFKVSINEIINGKRLAVEEIEKAADQNLKTMMTKEVSLKKKLFVTVLVIMVLAVTLVLMLFLGVPNIHYISSGLSVSFDVSDGDLDAVFRYVDELEEAEIEYNISFMRDRGRKIIWVEAITPATKIYQYRGREEEYLEDVNDYVEELGDYFDKIFN